MTSFSLPQRQCVILVELKNIMQSTCMQIMLMSGQVSFK